MKKIFTLLAFGTCACLQANSQSTTVVISQAYGGGGATSGTPTYKYDYVELHNVSNTTQDISGFSIQYGSATGQFGSSSTAIYTFPASTTIAAGKYVLVQLGAAGTVGADLPVTPDFTTTNIAMSAASGKVALANNATALACGATATPCNLATNTNIVDVVSYGAANNYEGTGSVNSNTALTNVQGAVRKSNGCQDTNDNAGDFDVVTAPVPRNSATAAWNCIIMPVSLKSFSASLINKKAQLKWSTVNEVNMKGFSVLKSTNGVDFTEAIFINAQNGTQNNYTIADDFNSNVAYYRLKLVEKDGSFKYSEIVSVNNRVSPKLEIFPNPVTNNVILSHPKANNAVVRIISLDGKTQMTYVVENGATQSSIGVSQLVRGSYIAIFDNEGVSSNVQFVKQ